MATTRLAALSATDRLELVRRRRVHISVNDDFGSSWSRNVDITAGAEGEISNLFTLPDWFVANYSVVATGA